MWTLAMLVVPMATAKPLATVVPGRDPGSCLQHFPGRDDPYVPLAGDWVRVPGGIYNEGGTFLDPPDMVALLRTTETGRLTARRRQGKLLWWTVGVPTAAAVGAGWAAAVPAITLRTAKPVWYAGYALAPIPLAITIPLAARAPTPDPRTVEAAAAAAHAAAQAECGRLRGGT